MTKKRHDGKREFQTEVPLNSNLAGIKTLSQGTNSTIEGVKADLLKFKADMIKEPLI